MRFRQHKHPPIAAPTAVQLIGGTILRAVPPAPPTSILQVSVSTPQNVGTGGWHDRLPSSRTFDPWTPASTTPRQSTSTSTTLESDTSTRGGTARSNKVKEGRNHPQAPPPSPSQHSSSKQSRVRFSMWPTVLKLPKRTRDDGIIGIYKDEIIYRAAPNGEFIPVATRPCPRYSHQLSGTRKNKGKEELEHQDGSAIHLGNNQTLSANSGLPYVPLMSPLVLQYRSSQDTIRIPDTKHVSVSSSYYPGVSSFIGPGQHFHSHSSSDLSLRLNPESRPHSVWQQHLGQQENPFSSFSDHLLEHLPDSDFSSIIGADAYQDMPCCQDITPLLNSSDPHPHSSPNQEALGEDPLKNRNGTDMYGWDALPGIMPPTSFHAHSRPLHLDSSTSTLLLNVLLTAPSLATLMATRQVNREFWAVFHRHKQEVLSVVAYRESKSAWEFISTTTEEIADEQRKSRRDWELEREMQKSSKLGVVQQMSKQDIGNTPDQDDGMKGVISSAAIWATICAMVTRRKSIPEIGPDINLNRQSSSPPPPYMPQGGSIIWNDNLGIIGVRPSTKIRSVDSHHGTSNDDLIHPLHSRTGIDLSLWSQAEEVIFALKELILFRCRPFLRPETVFALNQEVRMGIHDDSLPACSEIDSALWRIWTFCRLFGTDQINIFDLQGQCSWLEGGQHHSDFVSTNVLTSWQQKRPNFGRGNTLLANPFTLASPSSTLNRSLPEVGLGTSELYSINEMWTCLSVLLEHLDTTPENLTPLKGESLPSKNIDAMGAQTNAHKDRETVSEEFRGHILTRGLDSILMLATVLNPLSDSEDEYVTPAPSVVQSRVQEALQVASDRGYTIWNLPPAGKSYSAFLKQAVSAVYRSKVVRRLDVTSSVAVDGITNYSLPFRVDRNSYPSPPTKLQDAIVRRERGRRLARELREQKARLQIVESGVELGLHTRASQMTGPSFDCSNHRLSSSSFSEFSFASTGRNYYGLGPLGEHSRSTSRLSSSSFIHSPMEGQSNLGTRHASGRRPDEEEINRNAPDASRSDSLFDIGNGRQRRLTFRNINPNHGLAIDSTLADFPSSPISTILAVPEIEIPYLTNSGADRFNSGSSLSVSYRTFLPRLDSHGLPLRSLSQTQARTASILSRWLDSPSASMEPSVFECDPDKSQQYHWHQLQAQSQNYGPHLRQSMAESMAKRLPPTPSLPTPSRGNDFTLFTPTRELFITGDGLNQPATLKYPFENHDNDDSSGDVVDYRRGLCKEDDYDSKLVQPMRKLWARELRRMGSSDLTDPNHTENPKEQISGESNKQPTEGQAWETQSIDPSDDLFDTTTESLKGIGGVQKLIIKLEADQERVKGMGEENNTVPSSKTGGIS